MISVTLVAFELNIWYLSWDLPRSWWISVSYSCHIYHVWNVSRPIIPYLSLPSSNWPFRSWVSLAYWNPPNHSWSLPCWRMWTNCIHNRWRMGPYQECVQIISWLLQSIGILLLREIQWSLWLGDHTCVWIQPGRHVYDPFHRLFQPFRSRSLWLCTLKAIGWDN